MRPKLLIQKNQRKPSSSTRSMKPSGKEVFHELEIDSIIRPFCCRGKIDFAKNASPEEIRDSKCRHAADFLQFLTPLLNQHLHKSARKYYNVRPEFRESFVHILLRVC